MDVNIVQILKADQNGELVELIVCTSQTRKTKRNLNSSLSVKTFYQPEETYFNFSNLKKHASNLLKIVIR